MRSKSFSRSSFDGRSSGVDAVGSSCGCAVAVAGDEPACERAPSPRWLSVSTMGISATAGSASGTRVVSEPAGADAGGLVSPSRADKSRSCGGGCCGCTGSAGSSGSSGTGDGGSSSSTGSSVRQPPAAASGEYSGRGDGSSDRGEGSSDVAGLCKLDPARGRGDGDLSEGECQPSFLPRFGGISELQRVSAAPKVVASEPRPTTARRGRSSLLVRGWA